MDTVETTDTAELADTVALADTLGLNSSQSGVVGYSTAALRPQEDIQAAVPWGIHLADVQGTLVAVDNKQVAAAIALVDSGRTFEAAGTDQVLVDVRQLFGELQMGEGHRNHNISCTSNSIQSTSAFDISNRCNLEKNYFILLCQGHLCFTYYRLRVQSTYWAIRDFLLLSS